MTTRILEKDFPRKVEAFMGSPWWFRSMEIVHGFHLNEDLDDTMQDILLLMHQKNYLARWDKSKGGSYSNWVLTFVINHCRRKYVRSHTRGGKAIEGALSLSKAIDEEGDAEVASTIEAKAQMGEDFWVRVEEVLVELLDWDRHPDFRPHSFNRWLGSEQPVREFMDGGKSDIDITIPAQDTDDEGLTGVKYARCPAEAFRLIVFEGLTVREISERFATSTSFINTLVAKMRPVVARVFVG